MVIRIFVFLSVQGSNPMEALGYVFCLVLFLLFFPKINKELWDCYSLLISPQSDTNKQELQRFNYMYFLSMFGLNIHPISLY